MCKNTVQFQKDLSLSDFLESYGTEEQCSDALFKLWWREVLNVTDVVARIIDASSAANCFNVTAVEARAIGLNSCQ